MNWFVIKCGKYKGCLKIAPGKYIFRAKRTRHLLKIKNKK